MEEKIYHLNSAIFFIKRIYWPRKQKEKQEVQFSVLKRISCNVQKGNRAKGGGGGGGGGEVARKEILHLSHLIRETAAKCNQSKKNIKYAEFFCLPRINNEF